MSRIDPEALVNRSSSGSPGTVCPTLLPHALDEGRGRPLVWRLTAILGSLFLGLPLWVADAATGDPAPASPWAAGLTPPPLDLFESGTHGYDTFRIPSLLVTPTGTVLAFCEGRRESRSDAGDIDLVLRRSTDGGDTWSGLQIVWDDEDNTCGNPTPVVDRDTGRIWLFLTWNLGSDHERAIMAGTSQFPRRVYLTASDDDGRTWRDPVELPHLRQPHWRWYATGPDKGIQLTRGPHPGRLVIPANHSDHGDPDLHPYRTHVILSDDHGASWTLGGVVGDKVNESTLVELPDGSILDNMRSYHGTNRRAVAISADGGQTWGPVTQHPQLLEPVCQASILRYSWPETRSRILFANPASTSRKNMTLRVSYDEGDTWPVEQSVYRGSAAYSCLAALPDQRVGLLFERDDYQRITLVTVPIDWVERSARMPNP